MRIEADDNQSIEPNTVLKSISDRVESVGDTLLHPQKIKIPNIPELSNRLSSLHMSLPLPNKNRATDSPSSFFTHLLLRALYNHQWGRCIDYLFAHLCMRDETTPRNTLIARLFVTTDEDADAQKINRVLGLAVGILFVVLVVSLICAFINDMIVSVMALFGIVGFLVLVFGFALLVAVIGIYVATLDR
jgi:hypothetical protein